jgi:hypothetical protein
MGEDTQMVEQPNAQQTLADGIAKAMPPETSDDSVVVEEPKKDGETPKPDAEAKGDAKPDGSKTEEQKTAEAAAAAKRDLLEIPTKDGKVDRWDAERIKKNQAEITRLQQALASGQGTAKQAEKLMDLVKRADPDTYAKLAGILSGDPEIIKTLPVEVQVEIRDMQRQQQQQAENLVLQTKEQIKAYGKQLEEIWAGMVAESSPYKGAAEMEEKIFDLMQQAGLRDPRQAYMVLKGESLLTVNEDALKAHEGKLKADFEADKQKAIEEALKTGRAERTKHAAAATGEPGGKPPAPPGGNGNDGNTPTSKLAKALEKIQIFH